MILFERGFIMGATVVFIIIGLPVLLYALLRGYQLLLMQQRYEALMLERKMMLEQGVPPEQLPPITTPEPPSLLPFSLPPLGQRVGEGGRRWLGGLPPVAVFLLALGTLMSLVGMATTNDAEVILGVVLLGAGVLLSLPPRQPRPARPAPPAARPEPPISPAPEASVTSPDNPPPPATSTSAVRHDRAQGWSIAGVLIIGTTLFVVGLIMTLNGFSDLSDRGAQSVLGLTFMGAGLWLYLRYAAPRPVPLTVEEQAAVPRGSLYAYLKAAILALGVAGGSYAVVQWGRFGTPEQAAMSLAIFPLALSLAFLAIHLVMSILDDRIDRVNSIVFLALLALGMNAFPYLYNPRLPFAYQVGRLAVIPVAIAAALLVTALLRLFLRRERKTATAADDGEDTMVLR